MQQDAIASPVAPARLWRRGAEVGLVVGVLLWAAHVVTGYVALGHDQSWYLYAAKQILHGTRLYGPHLEDSNPPLIYWLNMLPALAARVPSLPIGLSFFLYVVGLAALSSGWCYALLHRAAGDLSRLQRLAFAAAIFFAELNVQRATDIGQREQFMVIFVLPYLVAFGLPRVRALARGQIIAVSVVAALGFCIKPQHLLTLLAIQVALYWLNREARRLTSPQTLALGVIAVVMAAYVGAIVVFFPQYPQRIMPVLRDAYWAFGQTPIASILGQRRFAGFVLLAGVAVWRRWLPLSTMPALLLAACVGAHLAYAAQRTGWYYQQIPRDAFLALFGLWVALEVASQLAARRDVRSQVSRWGALALSAAAFVVLYLGITKIGPIFAPEPRTADSDTAAREFFASLPAHTAVYVFSADLMPAFPPVLEHDLVWASRAPHLLMLPAIVQNEWARGGGPPPGKLLPEARVAQMASMLHANVTADLTYWRPAYVLVSVCNRGVACQAITSPSFDMLAWFQRSPEFAAVWSGYRYERTITDTTRHAQWDVYARR